jgi:PAS domain S-box-containing protein
MLKSFMNQKRKKIFCLRLTPIRIAILYAVLGGLWIFFSDSLLNVVVHDSATIERISIVKGWIYVSVTAYILYLLIRRFEKTNLESEHQYRTLMEQASDGIFICDQQGNILTVNARIREMLGYDERELLKIGVEDIVDPEDLLSKPIRFDDMLGGKTVFSDRRLLRKDGTIFPAEISRKMLTDGRFLAMVRDVSEHRQKDAMLAWRNRQLELLSSSNRQINMVLDIPVVLRTLVNTALAVTGATSGTAGLMISGKMVFQEYNERGRLIPVDYIFETGYGVPGWVMQTGKPYISNDAQRDPHVVPEIQKALGFYNLADVPIFDRTGKLLGCFEIHNTADRRSFNEHDVEILEGLATGAAVAMENAQLLAEHRQVEASLRESEKKFRMLADNVAAAIFIYQDTSFRYLNSTTEKLTGYTREELLRMNFWDVVHPDYRQTIKDRGIARQQGEDITSRYEFQIVTKTGEERWVDFTSGAIEYDGQPAALGTAYDVTERKKLEEQFRQAHKMEAVGLLAGGVAHDFNNILTAIIGYGNLAKMKLTGNDPLISYIDQMLAASERAANLTRSLLAFSRKQIINLKPVNVNEIITGVGKLLARIIGEDIELKMDLAGRDMTILADSGQVEQVLMNLATNARDAMPTGGALIIKAEYAELDQEFTKRHGYGSQGKYALIAVTDTGTGMDEKTRERIFEPFFTTKVMGKGTGLGLSMVYGIVKQHEGFITVYSEPGIGTTFKIYLPLAQSSAKEVEAAKPVGVFGGTETILVAEDDEAVRNLTMTLLTESGYTVIGAPDGEQAVVEFMENKNRVRLLILDVIMPRKNGKEAFEEIRRIRPDIKVLFMSGYAGDIFEKKNIPEQGLNLIPKPISPTEFLKKVRETLDG